MRRSSPLKHRGSDIIPGIQVMILMMKPMFPDKQNPLHFLWQFGDLGQDSLSQSTVTEESISGGDL